MGRSFVDWATAVVDEGDICQPSVSFTYHWSGPIYETLAQSTEFDGNWNLKKGSGGKKKLFEGNKTMVDAMASGAHFPTPS